MEVSIKQITDEKLVYEACGATIGKDISKPSLKKLIYSEHSPIRALMFQVNMIVPSFVSVHFVRHSATGQQHFVKSLREDRCGDGTEDRNSPVSHTMHLNAQHLIDMSRKRLCKQASEETRAVMIEIKTQMRLLQPDLYNMMMPQCMYRGGVCYEFKSCGISTSFWRGKDVQS